jgi:hypothetical protein
MMEADALACGQDDTKGKSMMKPHQDDQAEPFFITEEVAAKMIASGYEFEP